MKAFAPIGCICLALLSSGSVVAAESNVINNAPSENTSVDVRQTPQIATFSIVARDPETGDYGVAVQSRYFAVGDVVPHAAANIGAVATQARGNLLFGPHGLALLAKGLPADEVIKQLLATDPLRDERQVGIVDANGRAASYTGDKTLSWAGSRLGTQYAVQGNLLAGPQVVDAIATAFEAAPGDFAQRLVYALAAGQAAGGDARGRQSAALLVVRENGGYLGLTDRFIDLHVEDHATPIRELARLLKIRQSQLSSERARKLVAQAETSPGNRSDLLTEARRLMLDALEKHPSDDYSWWFLAQIHLLEDRPAEAALAAQRALLENPAWRHLSPTNRESLGVSGEFLDALLKIDTFNRVWTSLAPSDQAAAR